MDVRQSLNADDNCSVITGDGQLSFIENDSFFARAPPQAASTVCRTKARRTMPIDSEMGSFLEEMPSHFSFEIGTRPKLSNTGTKAKDKGEMPPPMENVGDWSVVIDWCRENLAQNVEEPEMDGKSSLGILNLDDMDLSSNHLLMDSPRIDLPKHAISDKKARINLMEEYKEKTTSETKKVEDMRPVPFNNNSQVSNNSNTRKSESASRQGKDSPHLSETTTTKLEGSSQRLDGSSQRFDGSSSTGQDFKSDQPFARSQINTVKKNMSVPTKNDPPMLAAIRQSLFGQGTIGEEGEDGEVSVYNVEFEAEELQGLDDDFGEMNCSVGGESDEGSPVKTPTNSTPRAARYNKVAAGAEGSSVEEIVLDSIYLRPGTTGEEQSQRKLPYLSKVSLFDGGSGSGSEVDTEDELEQARKAQGMRHEAAGQAWQQGTSRPGLVGEDNRFPMTQRQSAEGDVVNSPVPGDGGGGGDGTSGSDSEDAGNSRRPNRNAQNYHGSRQMSTLHGNQGQRIRPMGDDLLSDLRFSRFPMEVDSRLSSRYLTPVSPVEDSQTAASFDVDEILGAEHEFDPGNRLEASGFNADDASALGLKVTQGSNPFAQKSSSFGSFGLGLGQGLEEGSLGRDDSAFSVEMMGSFPREDRSAHEVDWSLLQPGRSSSGILGSQEVDRMALGNRTAASGSPDRSSDGPFRQSQLLSRPNMGAYPSTSYTAPSLPTTSRAPSTGHVASQHSSMNTSERGGRTSGSSETSGPELKKSQENAEFAVTPRVTVSQTSSIAARSDDVFKKPTMPPPKAANFSKSVVRPKSAQSKSSNVSKSTDSATSVKSSASSYVDLEYRMSLSEQACAQREGLRRVPSFGGTSEMDLTINDEEFFGVNDAQAMLDADEVEFEEEHVIRQDDAMKDTGSPNDSWAYHSVMSVARPSWMEGPGDEGAVCVRISVGSYMRGRTEALGSLSGDGNEPRPEFGMKIASPPSCKEPPGRLIEEEDSVFESTRTSGVGEYGIATPIKAASTDVQDQTLTMDSLTAESPKALDFTLSATLLGFKPNLNPGSTANATKLSMGELSMMLNNTGISMNKVVGLHGSKSSKTKLPETHTNQGTESKLSPIAKKSPPKSSQLPIMKGSSLNRSFPKVGDSESSMLKSERPRKGSSCDSRFKSGSVGDSAPEVDRPSDVSSAEKTPKNTSPRLSNQSENDLWSSPNSSSYCANNTGLFDRLDEFKFSSNSGAAQQHPNLKTVEDREKSPPADGEDRQANISTNILMSKLKPKSVDEEKATKTNLVNSVNSNPTIKQISDRKVSSDSTDQGKNGSMIDHGYMPGHHIPDGTAYSQRSDYSHMDHKGQSREDVAGVDDVGLAESRGFDMLEKNRGPGNMNTLTGKGKEKNDKAFQNGKPVDTPSQASNRLQNLQPTQSTSPLIRPSADVRKRSTSNSNCDTMDGGRDSVVKTIQRHESWTQTSLVLRQSIGLQPELSDNDARGEKFDSSGSGLPPKVPLSSFKHNLLPPSDAETRSKPSLLTKKSLLDTDFARENLGREYSREVLDRIYSADAHGSFQCVEQTQLDDHFMALHSRESLETEWNTIRRETVDTTRGDFSCISDIHIGLVPPPTAQSTPFPPSMAKLTDFSTTISSSKVCPVDAPPALKFREACCVGISRKELLPLRNPTDRWMECFIEPKILECDGKRMSLEHFPFELRQRKFIIDPHKTFNVDVMFLPKRPGAYVAQVQVFSLSFLNRSQMKERDVVPVNISFQALAEDPWIKVSCDDGQCNSVDFGELLWGSCGEKTICIQNMGQATVPLRLAITSNKAWHCFAFEPEGRVSDVSIISGCHPPTSGQGRSIINISLPGHDQPFSYQEVKVWCRPPEKQFTKALARQPPEVFKCSVDIEVDTPCSRQPKLSTLHLKATVGVRKLHTQTNLKEIHIRSSPKASERTTVRLFNAGNLSLTVSFRISDHRDVFFVSPTSLLLKPHEDGSIVITFKPNLDSMKKFVTLLLMLLQPSGPVFELQIVGEVQEAVPENLQLLCDTTTLDFGGVALGKTCVKRYRLKNNNPTPVLLTAKVTDSDIRLAREADPRVVGSDTLDLEVSPTHTLPVYVMYAPLSRQHLRSRVTMRHPASGKYTVKIQGYGGVSRLHCTEECLETTFVEGHTCVTVTSFSMDKVKDIFLNNLGDRAARVRVAVYEDLKCTERLLSGEIIVQPSELSLMEGESKKMELVVGMKEAEFTRRQEQNSVGAALCFEYVDQVESNHPFRSKLIVGLVRGFAASGTPTTTTPLRSVRPYRPSYFSEIATDLSSRFSTTSDDMTERFSHGTESSVVERIGGWSVKPSKLVIYCSNRGQEFETFYIYNHNSVEIRFEMFWPGGNLSLTPGSGTILPRENQCIRVYPTTLTTQSPPWSGQIIVSVDRQTESILVEVKQDASATNQDIPEKDNRSLVPISSNVNLSSVGTNRLGHLEVSRTAVQFPSTRIGKCSEQTIDISNIGPETLRWLFSSFAPPYMKRKTESSKDVFRVSYKVFDFSKQFGKLNAKETLQLTVQFMPRSAGTFTQYWDLQTSSNAGLSKSTSTTQHPQHQDYIRVHLTGEGQEDDTETPRGKSDVENLLPKLPSNKYSLRLGQEQMEFPCMERGNRIMLKLELKNNHMEDVKVEVTAPQPPFHVNHSSFKIQKKKYLRLPIEFQPTRPGRFTDVVKFQSSKGDNLILHLSAECRSTHLTSLS
ncbi:uncharacterized protein LOC127845662 isoform X2 [Dreissena polymorpha]|uniref:uncharacterized protein LOC127845662 isoform X2 n=1 Tax=Dreissena polymorpha TaxID=45954 RepID=UPI0022643802|nr:uncharacterized protein LOC127845662 isoform X2 [Dreissena polymorpha]